MNYDMSSTSSSSNIARRLYTNDDGIQTTIVNDDYWLKKAERGEREHLLHHIDLNNDDHFLICPQRTWWAYRHLVTPLENVIKTSVEMRRLREVYFISILVTFFIFVFFSQKIFLCQGIEIYIEMLRKSMCMKIPITTDRREDKEMTCERVISSCEDAQRRKKNFPRREAAQLNQRKPEWTLMVKDALTKSRGEEMSEWMRRRAGVLLMISLHFTYLIKLLSY